MKTRLIAAMVLVSMAACGRNAPISDRSREPGTQQAEVVISARNLCYGANLDNALAAVSTGDPNQIVAAVSEVWEQLQVNDFVALAEQMADKIADERPAVMALQAASLWRSQFPADTFTANPTPAQSIEADYVQILLDALTARGQQYEVVALFTGLDAEFPRMNAGGQLEDLRLTDRQAILARRGAETDVVTSSPQTGFFQTNLVLPGGLEILRGWASVDVDTAGQRFRFVTTHIEFEDSSVRVAQAGEILAGPSATQLPLVVVGDLNPDANAPGVSPPAFELFQDAGFLNMTTYNVCCMSEFFANPGAVAEEDFDMVLWWHGFTARGIDVQTTLPATPFAEPWPLDHAGVSAWLVFE